MAIQRAWFKAAAVDPTNGSAALQITDAQTGGMPGWEVQATASDSGSIIALTLDQNEETPGSSYLQLTAEPVAVGTATVTISSWEDQSGGGGVQTGTLTCTVTSSGGHLVAAWASGTVTLH